MKHLRKIILLAGLALAAFATFTCNAYDLMGQMYPEPEVRKLKVFVTSVGTWGDMKFATTTGSVPQCLNPGFSNANCVCQQLAINQGLTSNGAVFKAWISQVGGGGAALISIDAACNIVGQNGTVASHCNGASFSTDLEYSDLNGNTLFTNWNEITSGSQHPHRLITLTETKSLTSDPFVWTGTYTGGYVSGATNITTCSDWNSTGSGIVGSTINLTNWTYDNASASCTGAPNPAYPIYCFEQP